MTPEQQIETLRDELFEIINDLVDRTESLNNRIASNHQWHDNLKIRASQLKPRRAKLAKIA